MKKLFLLPAMCLIMMLSANRAAAQSGTTGACTWALSGSYYSRTLTISGSGAMGNYTFYGDAPWDAYRDYITAINIQQGVTAIGDNTFNFCDITSITIPNSVTSIGVKAFSGCDFTSITIPNSIISIGEEAFYFCLYLTSVTILNSVTYIGDAAFAGCEDLVTITVDAGNPNYSSINGVLFDKLQHTLVQYPAGRSGSYTIPNSVTAIGNYAFSECGNLTSVTIPNSVTAIGNGAFYYCDGLTSATIPNSVTTIGERAFYSCDGLTSVTIGNSVTTIGEWAFAYCEGITSLTIGNSVTTIGIWAFAECDGLTSLTIPNSVTTIGAQAFIWCEGITSVTIGDSVTTIGKSVFYDCTSLTTVNFNAINISSMEAPLSDPVFENCPLFSTLTIGSNVDTIPAYLFYGCSSLTSITSHAVVPPACSEAFINVPNYIPVYVPCLTQLAYQNAPDWGGYFNNFVVDGALSDTTFYSAEICYGSAYNDGNFSDLNSQGTYYAHLENMAGCDSVVVLSLSISDRAPQQELCMISVDNSNHNEIVWKRDEIVDHYKIYREGTSSGQYNLVASIDYDALNQWTDTSSNASIMSYRYKVAGVDSCGNESELSNAHKTMHLTINQAPNGWNLVWTPYEGISYQSYNIYRFTSDTSEMEQIVSMPSTNSSYTDLSASQGYVYYVVEIVLDEACELAKSLASIRSNIATNNTSSIASGNRFNNAVTVYPNPAKDNITVTLPETADHALFTLYDMQGKALIRQEISSGDAVEISHLSTGIYLYQVTAGGQRYQGKVVKS